MSGRTRSADLLGGRKRETGVIGWRSTIRQPHVHAESARYPLPAGKTDLRRHAISLDDNKAIVRAYVETV
jgi:hypothetical protein